MININRSICGIYTWSKIGQSGEEVMDNSLLRCQSMNSLFVICQKYWKINVAEQICKVSKAVLSRTLNFTIILLFWINTQNLLFQNRVMLYLEPMIWFTSFHNSVGNNNWNWKPKKYVQWNNDHYYLSTKWLHIKYPSYNIRTIWAYIFINVDYYFENQLIMKWKILKVNMGKSNSNVQKWSCIRSRSWGKMIPIIMPRVSWCDIQSQYKKMKVINIWITANRMF